MLSSQIMTLGSSTKDVTLFLTIFDTPLTLFSKRLRYKIIDPFPLNPWRHLSSRIDIREFFFNSVTGKSFTIDLVESMNALKNAFLQCTNEEGAKKVKKKKNCRGFTSSAQWIHHFVMRLHSMWKRFFFHQKKKRNWKMRRWFNSSNV